ncbi:response regulator receiver domain-containing protein [Stella humosa]|uniref:Response regulator receiver domain-containing protein n=2 Tax=Stella humosa TaxID=94 RepID=A0A3N1L074_9PROT|nr:response regulator receiver domain-containing protein [Stella humosa]BBK33497.1 hypothetical protein STHU_41310 [Stella humosa]
MRALVVDDVPEIRELISVLLTGDGFRVEDMAESAEEAFLRLKLDEPAAAAAVDVILLDVMLPGIDGIAACGRIKSDPRYRDVPVLMVTARQENASLQQAFAAGAADYIRKPVQKSELLARVRSALRLRMDADRRPEPELPAKGAPGRVVDPQLLLPHRELIDATLEAAALADRSPPMALVAIRIDGHVALAERHGGEALLRLNLALADRMGREPGCLGDLMAQDGEDRLFILLRRTQAPDAEARTRRWVAAIAAADLGADAGIAGVTASAGMAWCPGDLPGGLRELPGRALAALHAAANSGGGRLEIA